MSLLYNPSLSDLVAEYTEDNGSTTTLTIEAGKTKDFSDPYDSFLERRLVFHVFFERGQKINPEIDMENIKKEIRKYDK